MANIQEVARLAGVSPTTVSHVINNTRFVSTETRARVEGAMQRLGYQPNAIARSLRRGQTHTLGLILPDSSNPFFAEIGRAMEAAAFELGYSVILCNTEGNPERERLYVDLLSERQVDCLIFVAAGDQTASLQRPLGQRDLPVVLVDRRISGIEVDSVLTDNYEGGRLATGHLIALGHRRIGCVSGPSGLTPSGDRVEGYRRALSDAGLPVDEGLIGRGDFHPESGRAASLAVLQRIDRPTALFMCNDLMAVGAIRAAAECGLSVPDDLAIVGFDDIELASYTSPPLTTVAQPKIEMGRAAVQIAVEHTQDKSQPARHVLLPVRLIVRQSSGGQP